jgi:hypothetical protein
MPEHCPHGTHLALTAQPARYANERCVADSDSTDSGTTATVEQPSSGPSVSLTDHSGGPGVVIVPVGLIAFVAYRVLRAWYLSAQRRERQGWS